MKKLALALLLFLTFTNAPTVAAGTENISMSLEERIRCLDLPESEKKGMRAWMKEHKLLVGTLSAIIIAGGGFTIYDGLINKPKLGATKTALNSIGTAAHWLNDNAVTPTKNGIVAGAGWTADTACAYWEWDKQTYHATTIGVATVLALLTVDVSRSADKSFIKSFIRSMLGGCSKDRENLEV